MTASMRDYRRRGIRGKPPAPSLPYWALGIALAIALLGIFAWLKERDENEHARLTQQERIAAMVKAGYLHTKVALLTIDLNACPPRTPGTTDLIVFTISTQADGGHVFHGCSRIAERKAERPDVKLVSAP